MLRFWKRSSLGQRGERAAIRFLKREGYRILAKNLRNRFGEMDVLAQLRSQPTIVIVEVKAGTGGPLQPEVHVNAAKQRKLIGLAVQMARRYHLEDRPIRFDVIGVDFIDGQKPVIRHHVGAFESTL